MWEALTKPHPLWDALEQIIVVLCKQPSALCQFCIQRFDALGKGFNKPHEWFALYMGQLFVCASWYAGELIEAGLLAYLALSGNEGVRVGWWMFFCLFWPSYLSDITLISLAAL
jgi:hypothetical protein